MEGYSLGQPFWVGNGESVGFVGWNENPRRLGIIYCTNRLSAIFTKDLTSEDSLPEQICGSNSSSIREPRRTPDGNGFVYLENDSGGPHRSASRLMLYNFKSQSNEVLIDSNGVREVVQNDETFKYGKICAFFSEELPQTCFSTDGKYLIANTSSEMQLNLILIDIETKKLRQIEFPLESVELVDVKDDLLVVIGSSATVAPNVFVGKLNDISEPIDWFEIKTNSSDLLSDITAKNYWIPSEDPTKLLTFILISPKSVERLPAPTVVLPHGGPHSNFVNAFMSHPLKLAKLGFKTLLGIN